MSSWTPDKIKDPAAVKYQFRLRVAGCSFLLLGFMLLGKADTGGFIFGLLGAGCLYAAKHVKIWREKKAETAVY